MILSNQERVKKVDHREVEMDCPTETLEISDSLAGSHNLLSNASLVSCMEVEGECYPTAAFEAFAAAKY